MYDSFGVKISLDIKALFGLVSFFLVMTQTTAHDDPREDWLDNHRGLVLTSSQREQVRSSCGMDFETPKMNILKF